MPRMPGGGGDLVEQSLTATGDDDLIAASMENLGEGAADTARTASDEDGVASEMHRFFPLQDVLRIVRVGFTYRIGAA